MSISVPQKGDWLCKTQSGGWNQLSQICCLSWFDYETGTRSLSHQWSLPRSNYRVSFLGSKVMGIGSYVLCHCELISMSSDGWLGGGVFNYGTFHQMHPFQLALHQTIASWALSGNQLQRNINGCEGSSLGVVIFEPWFTALYPTEWIHSDASTAYWWEFSLWKLRRLAIGQKLSLPLSLVDTPDNFWLSHIDSLFAAFCLLIHVTYVSSSHCHLTQCPCSIHLHCVLAQFSALQAQAMITLAKKLNSIRGIYGDASYLSLSLPVVHICLDLWTTPH